MNKREYYKIISKYQLYILQETMNQFISLFVVFCAIGRLGADSPLTSEEQEHVKDNLEKIYNSWQRKRPTDKFHNNRDKIFEGLVTTSRTAPFNSDDSKPDQKWDFAGNRKEKRGCGFPKMGDSKSSWTVRIMNADHSSFYGSLIHPQVVLTAAHHISVWEKYKVRAGKWDDKISVLKTMVHPKFDQRNLANNVALLFLAKSFSLDDDINVICLPEQGGIPSPGTECFSSSLVLPIIEFYKCQDQLRTRSGTSLHNTFICAGGKRGVDTCRGDGGAPLACPIGSAHGQRYQLSGIVSWGIDCYQEVPAAYTNVALFRDWIDIQMKAQGLETSVYTAW
ncbi:phenoloxidase-activating factor 2-like [Drosophila ficusphila]|uniref:phenoloxidase-activating factor 2-like n=1 Tax=Drosophila ficusphila TaxID=30025 RepID=UPI0007E5C796|nr:phenoloxidase-activating factor 2-like [Drosophila ficusphila]